MPANYRCRIIKEFNDGKYPYIIASECNDLFDVSDGIPINDNNEKINEDEVKISQKVSCIFY